MIKFNSRDTMTSTDKYLEDNSTDTRRLIAISSVQVSRQKDEDKDSKTIDKQSVCFFMQSASAMPQKPSMLLEEIHRSERWEGQVIEVEEKTVIADAYQIGQEHRRYRLKIEKSKIQDADRELGRGSELIITNQLIKTYQGKLEKKSIIRVRKHLSFPEDVIIRRFEERMARYSYMFNEEE